MLHWICSGAGSPWWFWSWDSSSRVLGRHSRPWWCTINNADTVVRRSGCDELMDHRFSSSESFSFTDLKFSCSLLQTPVGSQPMRALHPTYTSPQFKLNSFLYVKKMRKNEATQKRSVRVLHALDKLDMMFCFKSWGWGIVTTSSYQSFNLIKISS